MHSFRILWLKHPPKNLGQLTVYPCVASPFLLITPFKHLDTEDTIGSNLASGIFLHSSIMQVFSCTVVQSVRRHIVHFIMHYTVRSQIKIAMKLSC